MKSHGKFLNYKKEHVHEILKSDALKSKSDDKIDELRIKIYDIIFAYAKKFINLTEQFAIQYVIYILIKNI